MPMHASAADFVPPDADTLDTLRDAVQDCRGCPLHERATQAVFGEGDADARVVLVGEVPGDQEDRKGRPFVGPAGRLLDDALKAAELDREGAYVTNAVKHFSWEPRGKRRLHKRPRANEIDACRPWLQAELGLLSPDVVVCLGATAAQAAFGKIVRFGDYLGDFHPTPLFETTFFTRHPSAILRIREDPDRERAFQAFVDDLAKVRQRLTG